MNKHPVNGWFSRAHLIDCLKMVAHTALVRPTQWLHAPTLKYVEIRIDMRSDDFIIKDACGKEATVDDLKKMFPRLFDEGHPAQ